MPTKTKRSPRLRNGVDPERLYNYEEIAELCGVSARRVKRWVEEGKIAYTILPGGRARRISGRQYLDALRDNAVEPEG